MSSATLLRVPYEDGGRADEPPDGSRAAVTSAAAPPSVPPRPEAVLAAGAQPVVVRPVVPKVPTPRPVRSPLWFEIGLLACVLVVVGCGGLGLALAVAGHYSLGVSLGGGLPVALLLTLLGARGLAARPAGEPAGPAPRRAPAVVAVLLAAGSALWNGWFAGSWINIDRDPAAYAMAARWISEHGTLQIPFGDSWAFTGVPVTGSSAAVYAEGDHLEFQFNHLLPVLLAQVRDIAGDRAMLTANAVLVAIGLLAVYAVAVRLTGRPWLAVIATCVLGVSLPVVFVARATFSEGVTMLLVWAGTWLLVLAWDRAPFVLGLLGGAALGAASMARVDSLVYLLVLPLLAAAVGVAGVRDGRWRRVATLSVAAVLGAASPVVVGTIDVEARAGQYYRDLAPQIKPLQYAAVLTAVVGAVVLLAAPLLPRVAARVVRPLRARRDVLGAIAAVAVVLVLVLAWAVRPAVDHPTGPPNPTVEGLQRREGLVIEPGRLYAEQSMVWLSWYLGPVALALGIAGLGALTVAAARARSAALVVLAVAGAGTALYLYRLSNTPDQLFGVRRFVPAAMPLFVLGLAAALAAVPARLPQSWSITVTRAWRRWRRPAVVVLVIAVVAFPIGAVARVWDFTPRRGSIAMFDDTCSRLGPDAAVVFARRSYGSLTYPQVIRDFCRVPVASGAPTLTVAQLQQAAAAWKAKGRTLWIVDSTPDTITDLFGPAARITELGRAVDTDEIADTLTRPPTYHMTWERAVYGMPVPD